MQIHFGESLVELTQGNIVEQETDAIVNAANSDLAGGGGVDGAIHRAAGPAVMQETRLLHPKGCETGSAVLSSAGNLSARHIIHAVGPVWAGGRNGEPEMLRSAYRACLQLAIDHRCDSIAFPAISTGAYGYPIDLAARGALQTVRDFVVEHNAPKHVLFVLFGEGAYGAFALAFDELIA